MNAIKQTKTAIVTGASSGIGLGIAKALLQSGYTVVASSRNMTKSGVLHASDNLVLLDGDVGDKSFGFPIERCRRCQNRSNRLTRE